MLERVKDYLNIALQPNYDERVKTNNYEGVVKGHRTRTAQQLVDTIVEYVPVNLDSQITILDIAAGTGIVSKALQDKGYAVTAFDLSAQMLKILEQKKLDITIKQGDMNQAFPFEDNSFRAATILWGNRFIRNLRSFTSEVYRVLENGGVFLWPVQPIEGLLGRNHIFLPSQLRSILEDTHFEIIDEVPPPVLVDNQPPFHSPGYIVARK